RAGSLSRRSVPGGRPIPRERRLRPGRGRGPQAGRGMKTGVPEIRRSAGQEALVLLLALAAFVAAVAPALRETGTPPGWDQSIHLRDSLVYERILRHPSVLAGGVLGAILHGSEDFPLFTPSCYYPTLVPGITSLLPRVT